MSFWIEGVTRGPEGFMLETVTPQGRQVKPMDQMPKSLDVGKARQTFVTADLASWARASAKPFWQALGIEHLCPEDGQGIFEYRTPYRVCLIPASVLLTGLFRQFKNLHTLMFKPQGLDSLCSPILEGADPKVGFHTGRARLPPLSNSPITHGALSWALCFPSGRAMWDSVYQSALQGRLDYLLPKARIRAEWSCVDFGDFCLVTSLTVTQLEVLEDPFGFAGNHPKQAYPTSPIAMRKPLQKRIMPRHFIRPRRDGQWLLSDDEWKGIEPILASMGSRKFPLRETMDALILKFGAGHTWQSLRSPEPRCSYMDRCRQFRRKGVWMPVVEKLNELRSSDLSANP